MLCLSQENIEIIGESVLQDYSRHIEDCIRIPIDIESFARDYLGLAIRYEKLSERGKILGLTTYKGITLAIEHAGGSVLLSVPQDTILLDGSLKSRKMYKRMRFTVAHECAHHILSRIEEQKTGNTARKDFSLDDPVACRGFRSSEDWNEWQANTLASVLLMPRREMVTRLNVLFSPALQAICQDKSSSSSYTYIKKIASKFGVSNEALIIRTRKLGYITKPEFERLIQIEKEVLERV